MNPILVSLSLALACGVASAQRTITYRLAGDFAAVQAGAPTLDSIGAGAFVTDTLAEVDELRRTSYRFERGSGLAFDNGEAGDFLAESYTIELYFRFDDLVSWRRIVDYKDRTSDNGLYGRDGRINFYNITTSPEAPLVAGEYAHVIVTRDASADDRYAIYVDGELATAFADVNGEGLLGDVDSLVFFRDDLRVPDETSAGNVSLVRLYDYALDSLGARSAFVDLGASVGEPSSGTWAGAPDLRATVRLSPNPTADALRVELLDAELRASAGDLTIAAIGMFGTILAQWPYAERIELADVPQGVYSIQLLRSGGAAVGTAGVIVVR